MGFFQNPHCNRPFNSRLNRARVIYGVYRKKTLYPTQAAHPGVLANPPTLGAVGFGQTGGRAEKRTKGKRGGRRTAAARPPCSPEAQLCSAPKSDQLAQPCRQSLGESALGPGSSLLSGASGSPVTLYCPFTGTFHLAGSQERAVITLPSYKGHKLGQIRMCLSSCSMT